MNTVLRFEAEDSSMYYKILNVDYRKKIMNVPITKY